MTRHARELDARDYERTVRDATVPVIIELWSEWCTVCRQHALVIERLAEELRGSAIVGSLNVISHPEIADGLGIASVPMTLFFDRGQIVRRIVGPRPFEHLVREARSIGPAGATPRRRQRKKPSRG